MMSGYLETPLRIINGVAWLHYTGQAIYFQADCPLGAKNMSAAGCFSNKLPCRKQEYHLWNILIFNEEYLNIIAQHIGMCQLGFYNRLPHLLDDTPEAAEAPIT